MKTQDDLVDCKIVQQALTDSGISMSELARRLGYITPKPDFQKTARRMGLTPHHGTHYQKQMGYERAVDFIQAMGLEPVDYGL